jgi:hypothetical protein
MSWIHRLWDSRAFHWAGALVLGPVDWLYSLYWSTTGGPSVPYWRDWQSRKLPPFPLPGVSDDLPVKTSRSDNGGAYLVTMVVTYVDLDLLKPLVPPHLEFSPSRIHHDGLHPIIYMFGYTQHLHFVWWPIRGFGYLEFAVAIPGLRMRRPGKSFVGPFTYVPVLYLHQLYPTLLGWMVGYNKKLRAMSTGESKYHIHDRETGQEIVRAEFTPCAPPEHPPREEHIPHWEDLTMQPQVNGFLKDSLLFLHYHLDWPNAIVQPVEAEVDVLADDGIPGLTPGHYHWPGINIGKYIHHRAPEGAFRLWAPFELLAPFTRRKLDGWIPPHDHDADDR